jgi:uncharacterized linocin/CFP29 family protein
MDYLRRPFAPLSDRVWTALDEAVAQTARHILSARRVATFDGPKGWETVGVRVGTMPPCQASNDRASVCLPDVVLLAEIRADFTMAWSAIEGFERGAPSLDTEPAEAAARQVAIAEDLLVFYGEPAGSGLLTGKDSPRVQVHDWTKPGAMLADLLKAVETLDALGVPGPYEAVLPPRGYYMYHQTVDQGGYPTSKQLAHILAGVHRSNAMREPGALVSTRGGDLVITIGGDLSVGYRQHDRDAVYLMCVETVAAQLATPQAVCLLAE